MRSAYSRGFGACMEGKTIQQNPFAALTREHAEWQDGWKAQHEHLNSRDDALDSIGWYGTDEGAG